MMGLLLAALLSSVPGPAPAGFWFFLGEVPVGTVHLSEEGDRYTYASTHFFGGTPRAPREVTKAFVLNEAAVPVSWRLWRRPPAQACFDAFDEVSGRSGAVCVNERFEDRDVGSAMGARYRARYRNGELLELELGDASFRRNEGTPPPPPDVFARGIRVKGGEGPLRLTSELPEERRFRPLVATLLSKERIEAAILELRAALPDRDLGLCLELAEALRQRVGPSASEIVYGLVLDGPRVYPHAWLRVEGPGAAAWLFDPALGGEVHPKTHLALPTRDPGELYLELWAGRLGVTREPPDHSNGTNETLVPAATPSSSLAPLGR